MELRGAWRHLHMWGRPPEHLPGASAGPEDAVPAPRALQGLHASSQAPIEAVQSLPGALVLGIFHSAPGTRAW